MKNFTFAILTALALGFSGCVVEDVPVESKGILPPDPGPAGAQSVAGVDSDGDGVRDDVQIFVHNTYADAATRAAALRLARAFQALLVTGTAPSSALTAAASMNRAIDCLYSIDDVKFGDRVDDVEAAVVNTGDRMRAYARAGAFLSGGTYSVSTVADNAASCGEAP